MVATSSHSSAGMAASTVVEVIASAVRTWCFTHEARRLDMAERTHCFRFPQVGGRCN